MYKSTVAELVLHSPLENIKQCVTSENVNEDIDGAGTSWLHFACRRSREDAVEYFLEIGAIIRKTYQVYGTSPFHDSILQSNVLICEMLIRHDLSIINQTSHDGNFPLDMAWECEVSYNMKSSKDVVHLLLDYGAHSRLSAASELLILIQRRNDNRHASIVILGLKKCGAILFGNGRDVLGLIAREVWKQRLNL